jgi:nicotinate-nucleotide adenylyltransferase
VVLIPAAQSPHKQGVTVQSSPAKDRLDLCRAAVAGDRFFGVSTVELDRPPPSYTYDTVKELFQQAGVQTIGKSERIRWLIGADQLKSLPRWHRAAELLQSVTFVTAARPGSKIDLEALPEEFRHLAGGIVNTPHLDISATDIRGRVKAGKPTRYLVPAAVEELILQRQLYR